MDPGGKSRASHQNVCSWARRQREEHLVLERVPGHQRPRGKLMPMGAVQTGGRLAGTRDGQAAALEWTPLLQLRTRRRISAPGITGDTQSHRRTRWTFTTCKKRDVSVSPRVVVECECLQLGFYYISSFWGRLEYELIFSVFTLNQSNFGSASPEPGVIMDYVKCMAKVRS